MIIFQIMPIGSHQGIDNYDTICVLPEVLAGKTLSNPNAMKKIFLQIQNFTQWTIDHAGKVVEELIACHDLLPPRQIV